MITFSEVLEQSRRSVPEREAVVCAAARLTYAQFGARVDALARGFAKLGLNKLAHAAVLAKNCHRFVECYFATARAGTVLVPLNYRLAPPELVEVLIDSEAQILLVDPSFLPTVYAIRAEVPGLREIIVLAEEAPDGMLAYEQLLRNATGSALINPSAHDDPVYLYYTSGTTGKAKGVELSHLNVAFMTETARAVAGYTAADRYLLVAPLGHRACLGHMAATLLSGGCVCVAEFSTNCLRLLQDERITVTSLVPTMINALLNAPDADTYDLSTWRLLTYGAAPMPEALIRRVASAFDVQLLQGYGMTELTVATYLMPEDHVLEGSESVLRRLRSAGRAVSGVEVRVVDDSDTDVAPGEIGEVIVRGPCVMLGYWKQPDATAEALRGGWMHTGDLGTLDEDDFLYIVDRKKDMIISGGENIYSTEVEAALYQHPAVLEAAVIGVPDTAWGESVAAIVSLKNGFRTSSQELRDFCRQRIAGYKVPRSVEFVEALPKTDSGKISKQLLRARRWRATTV